MRLSAPIFRLKRRAKILARENAIALTRVRDVPPSETLIDRLSDDDWAADDSASWKIECGSDENDSDELDGCDQAKVDAA